MANVLGNLLITLTAETSAFARGMGDAKKLAFDTSGDIVASLSKVGAQLSKLKFGNEGEWKKSAEILGGVIAGVTVAAAAATVAIVKQTADQAKELGKLSQSYGLPIEMISQLRVASKLTGVDMETLTMGIGRLAKAAAAAAEGGNTQRQAFQTLGVSFADVAGHLTPTNQLLLSVADRFSKMSDSTGKTALAMQLFGRSGASLIPILNEGAAGIQHYLDLAKEMGLTFTEEDIKAALKFKETLELVDFKVNGLKQQLAIGLIPALNDVSAALVKIDSTGNSTARTLGETLGGAVRDTTISLAAMHRSDLDDIASLNLLSEAAEHYWNHWTGFDWKKHFADRDAAFAENKAAYEKFVADLRSPQHGAGGFWGPDKDKGNGNDPTFGPKAPKNPNAGLEGLLNQAREAYNKAQGSPLETEISNIEALKIKLRQFLDAHPDKVFRDIYAAIYNLNLAEGELIAKNQAYLNSIPKGRISDLDVISKIGSSVPTATGEVQAQSQLIDLSKDINEQNRQRLEIYNQTRTPMEQYAAAVERLNILYQDKASEEYARAMKDVEDRYRALYDPTVRYEQEIARLTEARKAQLITEADYLRQLKLLQAQEAMERTVTNPQAGLAGVRQGLGAGAAAAAAQWTTWSNQIGQATIRVAQEMSSAMSDAFTEMIMGTKSVGQAFAEMGVNMLRAVVNAITNMIAQWIVYGVIMKAISKIFGIDPKQLAAQQISANAAVAQSDAGLAAANTLALTSAMYPPPMPEILAGIALGFGEAFASIASAGGGWDRVPFDQLAMVHKDEQILPASYAGGLRALVSTFSTPRAGDGYRSFAPAPGDRGGASGGRYGIMRDMNFNVIGGDPTATADKIRNVVKATITRAAKNKGLRF